MDAHLRSLKLKPTRKLPMPDDISIDDDLLKAWKSAPKAASTKSSYDNLIEKHARDNDLDPNLIRAIMHQESGGKPHAVSPKNARGLMQLIPATAERFGTRNIHDPDENIRGGARYLRFLNDRFKGNTDLVLAAYNAGEGAVEKFGNRIPPYRETQNYVPAVKARYQKLTGQQPQRRQAQSQPEIDPELLSAWTSEASAVATESPAVQPPARTSARSAVPRVAQPRRRQPQQGQVESSGLGAPPISLADLKQADEARIQRRSELASKRAGEMKVAQGRLEKQYPGAERANIAHQLRTDAQLQQQAEAEIDQQLNLEAKRPEIDALKQKFREFGGDAANRNVPLGWGGPNVSSGRLIQSLQGALANTGVQAGNVITAATLGRRGQGLTEQMRLAQIALGELEAEDPDKGWIAAAERSLPGASFELAKMYSLSKIPVAGRATLPALGATAEADRGVGEAVKGAAIGELYHRGFGAMSRLPKAAQFAVGTAAPAGVAIAEGADPKRAIIENTAFGAMALAGGRRPPRLAEAVPASTAVREAAPPLRPSELSKRVALRGVDDVTVPIPDSVRGIAETPRAATVIPRGVEPVDMRRAEPQPPTQPSRTANAGVRVRPDARSRVERATQPADIVPTELSQQPLRRNFRAGQNNAEMVFESDVQRDLYDLGAKMRYQMRGGRSRASQREVGDVEGLKRSLIERGVPEAELTNRAFGTLDDVRTQMKGVKDGETRQVKFTTQPPVQARAAGEEPRRAIETPVAETSEGAAPLAGSRTPSTAEPAVTPKAIVSHSKPHIDGGEIIGKTKDGKLKVRNNEGGTSTILNPRTQGNREAAIIKPRTPPTEAPTTSGGQKPPQKSGEKQPWQQTRSEYHDLMLEDPIHQISNEVGRYVPTSDVLADRQHRRYVEQAVNEGKPVPPEVLRDYPDLQVKVTTAPTTAELDGRRYTQRNGEWYRDSDGRRVAGIVRERLNAQVSTTPPAEVSSPPLPPATRQAPQTREAASQVETASPAATKRVPPLKAAEPTPTKLPPVEVQPRKPSQTAPKDAAMQADRQSLGLPELEQVAKVSSAEVLAKAKEANARDPRAADALITQALSGGKNFTNVETMQVNLRAQEAKNRINALSDEIYKATDPQVIAEKRAEQDALIDEVGRISEAQDLAGAEWSRAGTARQRAINQDFDLVSMVVRMKKARGRALTADERARIDHQAKRITELETKLAAAQETAKTASLQKQIDRVKRQTKRGETKQVLDAEFAALKQQFATAKIETRSGVQPSGLAALDPEGKLTVLIAKMARNRVKAGVVEAEKLVDEVYSAISDRVEGLRREDVRDSILAYGFAEGRERTRQTQLLKTEADVTRRLEQGDFSKVVRQPVVYTRETAALQRRIDDLKQTFERERYRATRSSGQKVSDELAKAAGVSKTIKSIGDLSAVFRQGGYYAITHPIRGGALPFRDMIRSFSDAGFRNVEGFIQNHPKYKQSVQDGVEYTGVNKDDPRLHLREEGFLGKEYLDYVPVAKQIKDFSERTFVSFLDSQRINMYDVMTDGLANPSRLSRLMGAKGGMTRAELKADRVRIAKMINSATGRGSLGKKGNQAAPLLNILMFSPRLVASRAQLLNTMFNPGSWARMPRNARAQILQDNVKFLAATTATLTLMRHLGAQVSLDPDDSEFLKIRIGGTIYDTLTGLQQPLRYLINMARSMPIDSETFQSGKHYAGTDPWPMTVGTKTRGGFLESKASPTASAVIENVFRGTNFLGRKRSIGERAAELVTPLPAKDVIEGLRQGGLLGAVASTPALLGIGVGSYPAAMEKPSTLAEKMARKFSRPEDEIRTDEEIEASRHAAALRARSRKGEDVSAEAAKLPERQQKMIRDAKGHTRLEEDFKRLPLHAKDGQDVFAVWDAASEAERALLKPILADKADAVDQLDPSKQSAVKAQLRAAGIVPVEELPIEKQKEIVGKRRLESREQSRARREKQRTQGRQRPSLGYGYN